MNLKRLDNLVLNRGLCNSREKAQAHILAGEIWSGSQRLDKPGSRYPEDLPLELRSQRPRFVSRGGEKLSFAIDKFELQVAGRICLDIGASTGGFTDCLLQEGAERVFAVDVGYGQLDISLRQHPRVSNLERTNARHLTLNQLSAVHQSASLIDLVVMDVSFISAHVLVKPLKEEIPKGAEWVFLWKPQFEVGQKFIGKKGRVKDTQAAENALEKFDTTMRSFGFSRRHSPLASPTPGKKSGNIEYVVHYEK